jgi:hypothetical protein
VLGDGAVDPEGDRSVLGRHRGGPQRALVAGDTNLGAVDDLAHVNLLRPAGGSPWPPPADPGLLEEALDRVDPAAEPVRAAVLLASLGAHRRTTRDEPGALAAHEQSLRHAGLHRLTVNACRDVAQRQIARYEEGATLEEVYAEQVRPKEPVV